MTTWHGVLPAVTTQFHDDLPIDFEATQKAWDAIIKDGVNGLIVMARAARKTRSIPTRRSGFFVPPSR